MKKIISAILCAATVASFTTGMYIAPASTDTAITAYAATATLTSTQITNALTNLKNTKYPQGSYWHNDQYYAYGGYQCYAFARQLAMDVFGSYPAVNVAYASDGQVSNGWTAVKDPSKVTLEPGDIIRANNNHHTAMIWKVEGDKVYVGECWGGQNNKINWGNFNGTASQSTVTYLLSKSSFTGVWKHPGSIIDVSAYKTVSNSGAGKMLNIVSNSSACGANVTVYQADGTTGQQFKATAHGTKTWNGTTYTKYVFTAKCSPNCALNVYGSTSTAGANVNMWTKSGNDTQDWIITSVSGGYIIRSANNPNLVLTASGTANGSNVKIDTYKAGNKNQIWSNPL